MVGRGKSSSAANHKNGHIAAKPKAARGKKHRNENREKREISTPTSWNKCNIGYGLVVTALALIAGILHNAHISSMFENERFFSHLSTLERELSFRTEMGLYYSYYKTIVNAPTFMDGLRSVTSCNITEYPDKVNVLRRFNLYPEVVLGFAFRIFDWISENYNINTKTCYTVNRGYNLPPVESCEGMGDLAFFYVYPIFWLNGAMMSVVFLFGTFLSKSIFGGILAVASYFFNHGEATRIMWTPPLRESFSFPFLIGQLLILSYIIRARTVNWKHSVMLCFVTLGFMLPWQFAQFALLTQMCALFGLYILKFISSNKLLHIIYGLLGAHMLNFVLQFANTLLMSSFFVSATVMALVIVKCEPLIEKLPNRILIWVVQGLAFAIGSLTLKIGIAKTFNIKDDAHIFDILKSKFSNFHNFHTLLYVCAPEFDFLEAETPVKLTKTLLLPSVFVATVALIVRVLRNEIVYWLRSDGDVHNADGKAADIDEENDENSELTKPHSEHVYILLQTIAFVGMAIIIMRLKLFGTSALCLMTSLLASRQLFSFIKNPLHHQALIIGLVAAMSVQGIANLKTQFNTKGEYNNPELEQLVEWIQHNSSPKAVFAGAMPTMAAVKLTTNRAIVNHPHYEDAGLRERTKKVYQTYSRKPCSEVHKALENMQVTHLIMEDSWCIKRYRPGCALPEVWDIEDPSNKDRPACCSLLRHSPKPFRKLFSNDQYVVLKV